MHLVHSRPPCLGFACPKLRPIRQNCHTSAPGIAGWRAKRQVVSHSAASYTPRGLFALLLGRILADKGRILLNLRLCRVPLLNVRLRQFPNRPRNLFCASIRMPYFESPTLACKIIVDVPFCQIGTGVEGGPTSWRNCSSRRTASADLNEKLSAANLSSPLNIALLVHSGIASYFVSGSQFQPGSASESGAHPIRRISPFTMPFTAS